jgi:hypothetical protein
MKKGWMASMTLTHFLALGFLPTPTVFGSEPRYLVHSETFIKRLGQTRGVNLCEELQRQTGTDSPLSPRFVLEMMGFPADWTTLPFLPGAINLFGAQGTP